jgi:hypothetical protein
MARYNYCFSDLANKDASFLNIDWWISRLETFVQSIPADASEVALIDLSSNNIEESALPRILGLLAHSSCTFDIDLALNRLTPKCFDYFLTCRNVNRVNLSWNYLSPSDSYGALENSQNCSNIKFEFTKWKAKY